MSSVILLVYRFAAKQPPTQQEPQPEQQEPQPRPRPQQQASGCDRERRPYHVVMTAASGLYQEWQSRIAYYHYKKQKALHPCSDLGGFTRLFNNRDAQPDRIMDEIPTLVVKQLGHGSCDECDHGIIVVNRPWRGVNSVSSHPLL